MTEPLELANGQQMKRKADRVAASKARALIEECFLARKRPHEIVIIVAERTNECFDVEDLRAYYHEYMEKGHSLIADCLMVAKDLSCNELPAVTDSDELAKFFSHKNTTEDLRMIYDRVRELTTIAKANNADDSFDARIVKYLDQAEKIRGRVIKNQFDSLRQSIVVNVGRKMVVAAIASFLPYVGPKYKTEAKEKFLKSIEPLINTDWTPTVPDDIQDIVEDIGDGQQTQE